jgi:hypothetical protein
MVYAPFFKRGRAPLDTMNDITFFEQQLGQICAILAG